MRLLLIFARAYPRRTVVTLLCLLLAALAEGVGLSSLLPLLGLATQAGVSADSVNGGGQAHSHLARVLSKTFTALGLQPSIDLLLCIIVAGMALKGGLVLLAHKQTGYTVAQVATDLRLALIRALLAARWEYYIRQPVGALTNSFASEASRASQAYDHGTTIVALAIKSLLYMALAAAVSWYAMVGAVASGAVIVAGLTYLVRRARRAGARQTRLLKTLMRQLTDVLHMVKPLKAMARESLIGPLLERETHRLNRALRREVLSKETLAALQELLVVAALAGGLHIALTRWGLPLDTVILLAVLFARTLISLNKVQKEYQSMVACESAFWSLRATIDHSEAEREILRGKDQPVIKEAITLRQVSFSYGTHPVLQNVSLRLPAGQLSVIVGPSGAGKTSLVDLIVGLVRPQAGEVWIDTVPLREVDLQSWRETVGYVPQETFLLHESVLVNVTFGDPALTTADVEAALRAAGAWKFVAALPEGVQTTVGERGARFSGGQRQRIAIARALVRKPQFLILDEATASLDPETEAALCATVQKLRGAMTILAISHQPALLEVADQVYRLEGGTVQPISQLDTPQPRVREIA
jgi:ATP-binding cassette subfamily C protein